MRLPTTAERDRVIGGLALQIAALRDFAETEPELVDDAIDLYAAAACELSAIRADAPRTEMLRAFMRATTFVRGAAEILEILGGEDEEVHT